MLSLPLISSSPSRPSTMTRAHQHNYGEVASCLDFFQQLQVSNEEEELDGLDFSDGSVGKSKHDYPHTLQRVNSLLNAFILAGRPILFHSITSIVKDCPAHFAFLFNLNRLASLQRQNGLPILLAAKLPQDIVTQLPGSRTVGARFWALPPAERQMGLVSQPGIVSKSLFERC